MAEKEKSMDWDNLTDEQKADSENKMRRLATFIANQLPKGYGFALLVFKFGKAGTTNYISNAEREDMVKALRECADRIESKDK